MVGHLLLVIAAYLLGSVSFGVLVARLTRGVDPRLEGSRNPGATNVARTCGVKWGVAVLVLDFLKGFAPVALAVATHAPWPWISLVAFAAVLGHCYSVFLGFKGGKAVATTLGVLAAAAPWPLACAAACCVAVIAASGFVSLGSLTLVTTMPLWLLLFETPRFIPLSLAMALLVYWRHRENIGRLVTGREKPWRAKRSSGETQ